MSCTYAVMRVAGDPACGSKVLGLPLLGGLEGQRPSKMICMPAARAASPPEQPAKEGFWGGRVPSGCRPQTPPSESPKYVCAGFPRFARKTRTQTKSKYRNG